MHEDWEWGVRALRTRSGASAHSAEGASGGTTNAAKVDAGEAESTRTELY